MYTLGNLMAQKYESGNQSVSIDVQPSTAQRGFDDTCSKSIAIGMTDNYILPEQRQEGVNCNNILAIPVAVSAVAVVYNLPGAYFNQRTADAFTLVHPVRLSAQVLAGIYSGTIRKWNDPAIASANPGMQLPAQIIRAFHSAEPGGSNFVFNQWLCLAVPSWNKTVGGVSLNPAWPTASIGTPSSGAMALQIKNTPYSIGFAGFDFAISYKLQAAALRNASGVYLTPSLNGLSKAIGYQLSNPHLGMTRAFDRPFVTVPGKDAFNPADFEFFVVHQDLKLAGFPPDFAQGIKAFLQWTVSASGGQQFIESIELRKIAGASQAELAHGFVPVPPEILAASQDAVNSITTQ
jgi:phosphate transport system substrate-binding protein